MATADDNGRANSALMMLMAVKQPRHPHFAAAAQPPLSVLPASRTTERRKPEGEASPRFLAFLVRVLRKL